MSGTSVVPEIPSRAGPGDFLRGLSLPFRALGLVTRSKKLFLLSLLSSVVTLASLISVTVLLVRGTDDLVGLVWTKPDAWYGAAAWYFVVVVTFVLLVVLGANTVPLLLLAPLQDPLSEATEELCGDFRAPPFSLGRFVRSTLTALGHTAARLLLLWSGTAALFALNLVPAVGTIAWTVLGAVWAMWWLSAEYLGGPMARHLYGFREVRAALAKRRALSLGFGAAVYALLWIPVLNFFFVPLAIVGGTLMFRSLRATGDVGTRPT